MLKSATSLPLDLRGGRHLPQRLCPVLSPASTQSGDMFLSFSRYIYNIFVGNVSCILKIFVVHFRKKNHIKMKLPHPLGVTSRKRPFMRNFHMISVFHRHRTQRTNSSHPIFIALLLLLMMVVIWWSTWNVPTDRLLPATESNRQRIVHWSLFAFLPHRQRYVTIVKAVIGAEEQSAPVHRLAQALLPTKMVQTFSRHYYSKWTAHLFKATPQWRTFSWHWFIYLPLLCSQSSKNDIKTAYL